MAQPSSPNFPSSYDDVNSLLGLPGNREVFTVAAVISVDDTVFQMAEDLSNVNLPCYITFEGGEIVYITAITGGDKSFECDTLSERGVLSTSIQPHGANEEVYITILSPNHNLMRAALMLAQKYQGLVGLDAAKGTPSAAGEAYVATDTDYIYRCFDGITWTRINYDSHANLSNLTAVDSHTQYHIDSRAVTWHGTQPGIHITSGDDHDHYSSAEGPAVVRIDGGLDANKPTGPADGQIYFATDLDGGTLHVGQGDSWSKIGGVPQGGIMAFDEPCPSGWTRYAGLNDAYPRGNTVALAGTTGGSFWHLHGYSAIREHYHTVNAVSGITSNSGTPSTHYDTARSGAISQTAVAHSSNSTGGSNVTYSGNHSHTLTVPAHSTENAGLGSGAETNSGMNKPESYRINWCQKD